MPNNCDSGYDILTWKASEPTNMTMTGKTISTSTLGLRFMQNAQRAKQLKEIEFERAEVKDDGQWEVPQEVRDTWGLISSPSSCVYHFYTTSFI